MLRLFSRELASKSPLLLPLMQTVKFFVIPLKCCYWCVQGVQLNQEYGSDILLLSIYWIQCIIYLGGFYGVLLFLYNYLVLEGLIITDYKPH